MGSSGAVVSLRVTYISRSELTWHNIYVICSHQVGHHLLLCVSEVSEHVIWKKNLPVYQWLLCLIAQYRENRCIRKHDGIKVQLQLQLQRFTDLEKKKSNKCLSTCWSESQRVYTPGIYSGAFNKKYAGLDYVTRQSEAAQPVILSDDVTFSLSAEVSLWQLIAVFTCHAQLTQIVEC